MGGWVGGLGFTYLEGDVNGGLALFVESHESELFGEDTDCIW